MTMNVKYINSSTLDLHQNESYCMKSLLYFQLFDDILTTADADIKSCVWMDTKIHAALFLLVLVQTIDISAICLQILGPRMHKYRGPDRIGDWILYFFMSIPRILVNLLQPTGYVMHHHIQQLYALPTLYLCVLYLSENKQRLVPLTV